MRRLLAFLPFLLIGSCTRNFSEVQLLNISGAVRLSGATDFSAVTVSLYRAADVDTALSNLRVKFPTAGLQITQSAIFDHRRHEAAYRTQTDAEGFFKFSDIPQGKYNLVAEKRGYGWRCFYDIHDDKLLPELVLYPEVRVAGTLDAYTVWTSQHHWVIVNDAAVPEGGTLLIDKGAVIRFESYSRLTVNGQLNIYGAADEMVWFTTDALDRQNVGAWKAVEIRGQGSISYARFDHGDVGIYNRGGRVEMMRSLFRDIRDRGVLSGNESTVEISECVFVDCKTAIHIESRSTAAVHHNLIANVSAVNPNSSGIVSNLSSAVITDNAVAYCGVGGSIEFEGSADFMHNFVTGCPIGVNVVSLVREKSTVKLELNTVTNSATTAINILDNATPLITQNNLLQGERGLFIRAYSLKYPNYESIAAQNNYFAQSAAEVKRRIVDTRTDNSGAAGKWEIVIDPVSSAPFTDAYPR